MQGLESGSIRRSSPAGTGPGGLPAPPPAAAPFGGCRVWLLAVGGGARV